MLLLEFFCDSGHVIVFQGSALKSHPVVINPVRQFPTIQPGFPSHRVDGSFHRDCWEPRSARWERKHGRIVGLVGLGCVQVCFLRCKLGKGVNN